MAALEPDLALSWALEFLDDPADGLSFRFWAGTGDLVITETDSSTTTYTGMNGAVAIKPPRERPGDGVKLTAEMDATDSEIRKQLQRDIGPLQIRVRWLWYDQPNGTWKLTGKEFIGRLSAPVLRGKTYSVNVESLITDIDRGRVVNWSNDTRQATHPDDKGFEFLRDYAGGIDLKWPPQ